MKNLGDVELKIYQIVAKLGKASVQDVQDEMNKEKETAYTTVMTFLKILKEKGFLDYEKSGKKFIYFTKIQETDFKESFLNKIIENVFKGSKLDLVQHLVKQNNLTELEISDLKKMVASLKDGANNEQ
jgi:BlaI family transcriptional regulator, penicillinase repressor